eukprot:s3251_g1.t1
MGRLCMAVEIRCVQFRSVLPSITCRTGVFVCFDAEACPSEPQETADAEQRASHESMGRQSCRNVTVVAAEAPEDAGGDVAAEALQEQEKKARKHKKETPSDQIALRLQDKKAKKRDKATPWRCGWRLDTLRLVQIRLD